MLPDFAPAPGLGFLPINSFVLLGSEPVLIDTGIPTEVETWLEMLWSVVPPEELRWIFLTHEDRDHSGRLREVLEAATNARLALNFIGLAKLGPETDLPLSPERLFVVNPGQEVIAGDRRFAVVRPPVYDSGATIGFVDEKSSTLFAADAFGALIPSPAVELEEVLGEAFDKGFAFFNMLNSAWLPTVDRGQFSDTMAEFARMGLTRILSTHLPNSSGMSETLIRRLEALPGTKLPMEVPDDAAFRMMLAQAKGEGRAN